MRQSVYAKQKAFGLTIALLTALTVMLVGAGTLWSVRSIYTTIEQEDALWEDLQQVGAAVRVFAAEQNRPPVGLQELRDMGYISPRTGEVFINREYEWKLEYGKVRIFLGKINEETGAESYVHDSKGVPYLVVAEYRSPEPVVYTRPLPVTDGEGVIRKYNDIQAFDNFGNYLFSFKTPDRADSVAHNLWSLGWSPASDRILITTPHDNKLHEYTFKGEKIRELTLDTSLAGATISVSRDGRIFVARETGTVGEDGFLCYSPDGVRLWAKKIAADFATNPDTVMNPILTASSVTPEGNVVVFMNGQTYNKVYNPSGTHLFTKNIHVAQVMPDNTMMVYGVPPAYNGVRLDSSWNPLAGATNILDTKTPYGAGVGQSVFTYGRQFVLSWGSDKLMSFDWNPDFSVPRTNVSIVTLPGNTRSITARKGTEVWVTSTVVRETENYISRIGNEYGIETSFNTNAMASFASRAVGVAPDETGNVYITSTTVNGIFKINSSGTVSQIIPSSYSYTGLEFDENGYLWAGRCFPQQAIDVFDVAKATPELVFTVETSGFIVSGIKKDPWGRMWAITSSGASTPDMLPRVYDKNGNFLFEFDGGGTLPSQNVAGIAFTPDGRIFAGVMGSGDNTVFVYNAVGELEYRMPLESGAHGYGMDIDITGRLWVAEGESSVVSIYDTISFKKLAEMPLTGLGNVMYLKARSVVRPKPEVFVSQSNITKVKALDSSLALSSEFGEYGTDLAWRMRVPLGVASVGDLLFTADRDNRKVHVSTPTGLYLRDFGSGVLKSPRDIEVDEVTGRAFVLDKRADGTMDIEVFDADGRYMENGLPWKGYREANPDTTKYKLSNDVQGLGYHGAYGRKSRLVVADTGNSRVVIYDGLGYYIHSITGLNRPIDAAVNPANLQVFVLEEGTSSVKVYNIIGQTHSLVRTIGSPGTADGKFDRPKKIAVAGGHLYVADYNRIQKFNSSTGTFVGSYRLGTGDARVGGLAVKKTPMAYLYAADYDRKRVIAYDAWGNFVTEFLVKKESGETPLGEALSPRAVAVDQDGNVFVADTLNFVRKYKPDGTFMTKFGGTGTTNGKLSNVYDMHIHDLSLYISERGNNRIQKFDTSGNFQLMMATSGIKGGYTSSPGGISVDPQDGKVWVADTGNHRLLLFDSTGTFARVVGVRGSGIPVTTPGGEEPETEGGSDPEPIIFDPLDVTGEIEVESPLSVAVTGQSMLIMDTGNGRVQQTTDDGVFQAVLTSSLPAGILSAKAGADQRIFAAWNTDRIVAVFRAGSSSVLRIGESGSGRGQLDNPVAVSVAPVYREYVPGKVYAAGADMKIRAYDDEMNYLFSFGGKSYGVGELINPWDIIERADNGNVHVIDNSRFYTFSSTGVLLNTVSNALGSYHHVCYESDGHIYLSYFPLYSPASSPANMRPVYRVNSDGSLTEVPFVSSPVMMDSNGHRWIRRTSFYTEKTGGNNGLVIGDTIFSKFSGNTPVFHITYSGMSHSSTSHINRQINLYGDIYAHGNLSFVVFLYPWSSDVPRYDLNGNYIDRRVAPSRYATYNTGSFKRNRSGELLTTMVSSSQNMRVFSSTMSTFTDVDFSKLPLVYQKNVQWRGMGGWKNGTKIFIVSAGTKKAYSFTSGASTLLAEYGYYNASTTNSSAITDVRTDSTGVYVFDMGNGNIRKYDFYGNFLWQWGDARNETGQFNSVGHTRSISMDATYLYVGDYYNRRLYVVRKSDGTHYKTLTTPVWINSVATDGAGNIIHGVYYYADVSTSPVYYRGTLSGTTMTAGPSNATYYATQRQGKKAYDGIGKNHAHFVDGKFLLMAELGWLYVYNTADGYVGRKQVGGSIQKDLRIYTQKNELWSLDYGASQIKVYDKASFFASATPTVKRTINMGLTILTFDIVP